MSQPKKKLSNEEGRSGLIVAHYGVAVEVRFADGSSCQVRVKRQSGHVVGDNVLIRGEVLYRQPRRTEMSRRDVRGKIRLVAANLDVLGIVVCCSPPPPRHYLDRAIVAARAAGIDPFLVVNKADLPATAALVDSLQAVYGALMPIFPVSASSATGLDALRHFLAQGHRAVFVGTSGVGKSSLLNALVPGIDLLIGDLSQDTGLGRHTTTVSTLHSLASGGELVDTPGFRDFGLVDISEQELAHFFPGFEEIQQTPCRFRNCLHRNEPGCLVRIGLQTGKIPAERYDSYLYILDNLQGDDLGWR